MAEVHYGEHTPILLKINLAWTFSDSGLDQVYAYSEPRQNLHWTKSGPSLKLDKIWPKPILHVVFTFSEPGPDLLNLDWTWPKHSPNLVCIFPEPGLDLVWIWSELDPNLVWI